MAVFSVCLFLSLALSADAAGVSASSASLRRARGFVKALNLDHHLRVCNAYPSTTGLFITNGKEDLTSDDMPYKSCKDFKTKLSSGDKLNFKIGATSEGTFSIAELPKTDSVLLLVAHRHDPNSTSLMFESHVFADLANAQVAVIDTYKGHSRAVPRIMDEELPPATQGSKTALLSTHHRSEELHYNSVVAVQPGRYEVALAGEDGETTSQKELVALKRESYVVLRTGVEARQEDQSFPEELVVFPESDPNLLVKPTQPPRAHSGAAGRAAVWWAPVAWAALVAACQ